MRNFNEFGITPKVKSFEGEKLKMYNVINKQIVVVDFKCAESKFKDRGSGKLLTLQIIVDNAKHILFTGSLNLIEMVNAVPKSEFPFITTIVKNNDRLEFT